MNTKVNSDNWTLTFNGVLNKRETSIPTLLTTGNGRIGIRGTIPEFGDSQGIYIAGFYDQIPRPELDPEKFNPFLISWSHLELVRGYKREVCIVKCPDFLDGEWEIGGEVVDFNKAKLIDFKRKLCLKTGEFTATAHLITPKGKEIQLTQKRFAHMEKTNLVYSHYSIKSINYTGKIKYLAKINTNTKNFNISGIYQDTSDGTDHEYIRLYDVVKKEGLSNNAISTLVRGRVDGMKAAFATAVTNSSQFLSQCVRQNRDDCYIETIYDINNGETIDIERISTFENSLFVSEPYDAVKKNIFIAAKNTYDDELNSSILVWNNLWEDSDVIINGDDRAQLGIRHSLYNLLIAVCRDSSKVSIPAKGLTGEGYRGMVFWDTDIHMLPFFIYTQPQFAKNIVKFRCNTINGARAKAAKYGNKGASFPWETGISGNEECEDFLKLITHQLHITADIVYAMQQYIQATGDDEFLLNHASKVYIETARFWVSKAVEREDGKISIPDASGPDELHIESSDSAYVNNLAAYNLRLADNCISKIMREKAEIWQKLCEETSISEDEILKIKKYKDSIRTMKTEDGIFEQCEGFFKLEDRIVFEDSLYDVPADTQTVKQADVLMLLYLLPNLASKEELSKNWNYYEPRTTHTSSLSYGVHGIIAAELGLMDKAKYYLEKSLGIDLYNDNDIEDGAHLAAYGMSWSAIINGFAGCKSDDNGLVINPMLPENWTELIFNYKWMGRKINIVINKDKIQVSSSNSSKGNLTVTIGDECYILKPSRAICVNLMH